MAEIERVMKIAKALRDGKTERSKIVDLFKQLNQINVNMEILTKTKIGLVVNEFRKSCKDDSCKSLAKNLIKKWKKINEEERKGGKKSEASGEDSRERADESIEKSEDSREPSEENSEGGRLWPSNPYNLRPSYIDDNLRLKMRQVLADALKCPQHRGMNFELIAGAIEDAVFDNFKDTGNKYVISIRSKIMSIKCKDNQRLKQMILDGHITPEHYSIMDYKDYASDEMKKQVQSGAREGRNKNIFSAGVTARSTLYKCSKCGKNDTSYTQAQTRSADEPMTTFISCNNCGKRWKQ